MATKKRLPWRTLVEIPEDQYGRFTREQIREAIRAVKAEREALVQEKKQADGSASGTAEVAERKKRTGGPRRAA